MSQRPKRNPFYTLLMVVSTLFVVTTLGYLIGPIVEQRVIDGKSAPSPFADWFERRGVLCLAIEFAAMLVFAVMAMFYDREPRKANAASSQPGP